ncbi:MAG: hypothetical protein RMK98_06150 [Bacteroidia bacterium]|nr:hypothetical protein [Bacteroidia bacterium]
MRFLFVVAVVYLLNGATMEGLYALFPLWMPWRSFWVRSVAALTVFPLSYILHRRVSFA